MSYVDELLSFGYRTPEATHVRSSDKFEGGVEARYESVPLSPDRPKVGALVLMTEAMYEDDPAAEELAAESMVTFLRSRQERGTA